LTATVDAVGWHQARAYTRMEPGLRKPELVTHPSQRSSESVGHQRSVMASNLRDQRPRLGVDEVKKLRA